MGEKPISFQKKVGSRIPYIPGTKPSVLNAQLITSVGIPSFDAVIGGGLPIGTIVLIEEDLYGTYAKLLIKYFLAEGAVTGHELLFASQDVDPEHLVKQLPAPLESEQKVVSGDASDSKMTIAWRYQNLRTVESSPSGIQLGHRFDLSRVMAPEMLKEVTVTCWHGTEESSGRLGMLENPHFDNLLGCIKDKLTAGQFGLTGAPKKRNLLRVAIHSLCSPLWDPSSEEDLLRFLYALRALMRSAYAVCMLSIPSHLLQDSCQLKKCLHFCDTSVKLESFSGSDKETNPMFKEYRGLFHITKLSAINTVACHVPESFDLAFKLRRRRFTIEKLHLPPELQETTQREQDDIEAPAMGCGTSKKNLLEF